MKLQKAIFLDKDGTLIKNIPYNVDPELVLLSDQVITGLKAFTDADYKLIVVSNQSGVAMGYFEYDQLHAAEHKIDLLLQEHGIKVDGYYYCPHHPRAVVEIYRQNCSCRKPGSGLIKKAAEELGISLAGSWMIGDILDDVEAGNSAGCRTVLIDNGNETEWAGGKHRHPYFVSLTINDAALMILAIA